MKNRSALLVGVGGQGTILAAKILTSGLIKAGYDVKMSEVHGMAQRGGSVSTQIHWGEKVYSPVIGLYAADLILSFEKMEAVRYADYLKKDGIIVVNNFEIPSSTIAAGICDYPSDCLDNLRKTRTCLSFNAADIAKNLGNSKCMNVVLLGAMIHALHLDNINWNEVITATVPPKFLKLNLAAFYAGYKAADQEILL